MGELPPRHEWEHRFWAKVNMGDGSGCWLWTASTKPPGGYGQFHLADRTMLAHRLAYRLAFGDIPPGLHIDHLCSVRLCMRPSHLEAVTQAENNRRMPRPLACPAGHAYTLANTRYHDDPIRGRRCRTCERDRSRAR